MRYHALACDYDGTLAHHGSIAPETVAGLERVRASGRSLVLVTGRQLPDLESVCPQLGLFTWIVAENGALLYQPATHREKLLCPPPARELVSRLMEKKVQPLAVGRAIVATWSPHESEVLAAIRELGLELHVIFNKGAVMVLPSGVNKATGLQAALDEMKVSRHNVVAVGDAENDHAFLAASECAVAVANALPTLKERADWVTQGADGQGVLELIDAVVASDLGDLEARLGRHAMLLGTAEDGRELRIPAYGINVLVSGTSGSGKSTFATGLLERLADDGYQFCVVDPEGDYSEIEHAVVLGDPRHSPTESEVMDLLAVPAQNVAVNLVGLALEHRPGFFEALLPRLQEMRARLGRPHWVLVDETHHLLPTSFGRAGQTFPQSLSGMVFITVHPDHVSPVVLSAVDLVVAIGKEPDRTLRTFAEALGRSVPAVPWSELETGQAGGLVGAEGRGPVPLPHRPAPRRPAPPRAQVCRGGAVGRAQLLLPRPRGQAQPAGAEPDDVPAARRRRRRRDLDPPPAGAGLLALVPGDDQGRESRRGRRAHRGQPRAAPAGEPPAHPRAGGRALHGAGLAIVARRRPCAAT
jgi:HAD superfamily hydrolase (TIGR01484 family)